MFTCPWKKGGFVLSYELEFAEIVFGIVALISKSDASKTLTNE